MAESRWARDAERLRGLFDRQTSEISELEYICRSRIVLFQMGKCVIECHKLFAGSVRDRGGLFEAHSTQPATVF